MSATSKAIRTNLTTSNVYFGGSFEPPHLGHHQMLLALCQDDLADKVHLVPTWQNPLKESSPLRKEKFGTNERRHCINLWIEKVREDLSSRHHSKLEVHWNEFEKNESSFTVDTLRELKEKLKGRWSLALGSDSLITFNRWKDFENLLAALHSVWVFERSPLSFSQLSTMLPAELQKHLSLRLMPHAICSVSSTEIRQLMKNNAALHNSGEEWLLPNIKDYLLKL